MSVATPAHFDRLWPRYGHMLATRLRVIRLWRGLTQGRLAALAGLSRNAVSNLERNENTPTRCADPVLSTVYRLAYALQVPPMVLLPEVSHCVDRSGNYDEVLESWDEWADFAAFRDSLS